MTRSWERQPWAEPYRLAVLELDSAKLPDRIKVAKVAINARIVEVRGSVSHQRELRALDDALNVLRLLGKYEA